MRLTDAEVRGRHWLIGGGGATVAVGSGVLAAWPLDPFLGPFLAEAADSAALVGGTAGSLAAAGALVHHRWYFEPNRAFRRELGDPDGWLSARDVREQAGARGLRHAATASFAGRDMSGAPLHACGWEAGRLVSGPLRVCAAPACTRRGPAGPSSWGRPGPANRSM